MANIKPISDLQNYGDVLNQVTVGSPVFLTKDGRGRYAVIDISEYAEYEKMIAWRKLESELEDGELSGEIDGWIPAKDARTRFKGRYCEGN